MLLLFFAGGSDAGGGVAATTPERVGRFRGPHEPGVVRVVRRWMTVWRPAYG